MDELLVDPDARNELAPLPPHTDGQVPLGSGRIPTVERVRQMVGGPEIEPSIVESVARDMIDKLGAPDR